MYYTATTGSNIVQYMKLSNDHCICLRKIPCCIYPYRISLLNKYYDQIDYCVADSVF